MQKFYAHKENFSGSKVTLTGEEYRHATRSCRVRIGEVIGVTDGCGKRVEARITSINSISLTGMIERDVSGIGEPDVRITVALSLIKPSRFECAVEKCTELGARRFIPLISKRCTCKPVSFKRDRLKKIAREAAKQAGRSLIPDITSPVEITTELLTGAGNVFISTGTATKSITDILGHLTETQTLTLIIGPEGDFTDEELEYLISRGAVPFSLGNLTLRSETAAITATAIAVNRYI